MPQIRTNLGIVMITLFITIAVLMSAAVWLVFLYPSDQPPIAHSLSGNMLDGMAKFEVSTQKNELEKAINRYLHRHVQTEDLHYEVILTNEVKFHGDVMIFGQKARLSVGFDPIIQQNGDLVLEQRYFNIGALSLPNSLVLEYVKRSYPFPDWIAVQPAQKQIYLASTMLSTENGIQISVQEFNLQEDRLTFHIYLP